MAYAWKTSMSLSPAVVPRASGRAVAPPRRVGVEIELGGVPPYRVAEILADVFDGRLVALNDIEFDVHTERGRFRVELDSRPLKERARRDEADEQSELWQMTNEMLRRLASEVVPSEIVTPPLFEHDLPRLDELARRLGAEGGRGTFDALRFAFGVHFNPEVPTPDADTLYRHIRAFSVLYPALVRYGEVDLARRLTPYIDPYPHEYVERVLATPEPPPLDVLIDDYLRFNPTRHRALDMLPLFLHLDAARVERQIDTEAISPRPTFHYRLANSRIGEPGWTISQEWRGWRAVERLAADRVRLEGAASSALEAVDTDWLDWIKERLVW